eukprot:3456489-Alexandrium_andersonii.AAC.1
MALARPTLHWGARCTAWLLARQDPRNAQIADCRIAALESATSRCCELRTPSGLALVGRFGLCARNGAERTPRELRGPSL